MKNETKHKRARTKTEIEVETMHEKDAKEVIRALRKLKNLSYQELCDRMNEEGIKTTVPLLRNKILNGKFKASYFLILLKCMDTSEIELVSILKDLDILAKHNK